MVGTGKLSNTDPIEEYWAFCIKHYLKQGHELMFTAYTKKGYDTEREEAIELEESDDVTQKYTAKCWLDVEIMMNDIDTWVLKDNRIRRWVAISNTTAGGEVLGTFFDIDVGDPRHAPFPISWHPGDALWQTQHGWHLIKYLTWDWEANVAKYPLSGVDKYWHKHCLKGGPAQLLRINGDDLLMRRNYGKRE